VHCAVYHTVTYDCDDSVFRLHSLLRRVASAVHICIFLSVCLFHKAPAGVTLCFMLQLR